jgi:hypothetical protein
VDHRSLAAQGIHREPEVHRGPAVSGIEARDDEARVGFVSGQAEPCELAQLRLPHYVEPFHLTNTVEIMPGRGPRWSHTPQPVATTPVVFKYRRPGYREIPRPW